MLRIKLRKKKKPLVPRLIKIASANYKDFNAPTDSCFFKYTESAEIFSKSEIYYQTLFMIFV